MDNAEETNGTQNPWRKWTGKPTCNKCETFFTRIGDCKCGENSTDKPVRWCENPKCQYGEINGQAASGCRWCCWCMTNGRGAA